MREAATVDAAVDAVLEAGYRCSDIKTPGCIVLGSAAMGDAVVKQLAG